MKKFLVLSFLFFLGLNSINAQQILAPARNNDLWGFIDPAGNWVIENQFNISHGFDPVGNIARVKSDGEWSYINSAGELITIPDLDVFRDYSEGLLEARKNDQWGFISPEGKFIIKPQYENTKGFSNGLAPVLNGKWGFINTKGEMVIPCQFNKVQDFSEGFAFVNSQIGWHYINANGESINAPKGIEQGQPFSEGLASASQNDQWGYLDTNGQWAITPQYTRATDFSGGYAAILQAGIWKLIDNTGTVQKEFTSSTSRTDKISSALTKVKFAKKLASKTSSGGIEKIEKFSNGLARAKSNGLWGYIDTNGDWVVAAKYKNANDFKGGYASVRNASGLWGVVNTSGQETVVPRFQMIKDFEAISGDGTFVAKTYIAPKKAITPSNTPPNILITKPHTSRGFKRSDGLSMANSSVLIAGNVTDSDGVATLLINNTQILLQGNGSFSVDFPLSIGQNILKLKATDAKGIQSEKQLYINYSPQSTVSASTTSATISSDGKFYALIIGIENYDDPNITDLDNPIDDASALYDILTRKYNFSPNNATLLKDPTRDEIYDNLDALSSEITTNDNLLIFYAGHGHWDKEAENGYWLPSDAEKDLKRDWMRNSAVTEYVKEIKSNHTLLITDACFGGSIFKTRSAFKDASMGITKLNEFPSRKAMTSGTLSEVPDKSVFMKYLLKKLETNEDKFMASEQLFYHIKPAVLNNSPNTPQFGVMQGTGDEGGDFIFILKK